jgi:hypothetical protein
MIKHLLSRLLLAALLAGSGIAYGGGTNPGQGVDNQLLATAIASASTVNLTAATGNFVHVTGTTTINTITLQQGAERTVIFDGILTLKNGASLKLPGNADIVTVAGDRAIFRGDASSVVYCIAFTHADGTAVVANDVTHGGTGNVTLTNHGVLVGAGTAAITQLAAPNTGTLLAGQGSSADPAFSATPTLGKTGTATGTLSLLGTTSGTVTIQPQAAAGTYNFNLPTTAGTSGQALLSGGGGSTAQTYGTLQPPAGGTGAVTLTAHGVVIGNGTSAVNITSAGTSGQFLMSNGPSADPSFSALTATTNVQTFTGSGTWTKPSLVNWVRVVAIGGGGSGGSGGNKGSAGTICGGNGGSGGAVATWTFPASILGGTETVTVGQGGAAVSSATQCSATAAAGTDGNNGTASSFGTWLTAAGGVKGAGAPNSATCTTASATTTGFPSGLDGGAGVISTTGAGNVGTATVMAPAGGASGAGTASAAIGGVGGAVGVSGSSGLGKVLTGGTAGAAGGSGSRPTAGGNGTAADANGSFGGAGGGGGGSNITAAASSSAGHGGSGGLYGGGGGGGGSCLGSGNTGTPGNGGAGANGIVIVTSW